MMSFEKKTYAMPPTTPTVTSVANRSRERKLAAAFSVGLLNDLKVGTRTSQTKATTLTTKAAMKNQTFVGMSEIVSGTVQVLRNRVVTRAMTPKKANQKAPTAQPEVTSLK